MARFVPALSLRSLTPLYDSVIRWTTRESAFRAAMLREAALAPDHRVLDVACGTGTLAIAARRAEPRAEVHGLDGDPQILAIALRKARAAGTSVRWHLADARALPFGDASFDRVLNSLSLHHLVAQDKARALGEMRRVLRPGGLLVLADWGRMGGFARARFSLIRALDGFENTAGHAEGRVPAWLSEAGFPNVREAGAFETLWGTLRLYRASNSR